MPKAGLYEYSVFVTMSGFLLLHQLEKKDLIAEDSLKLRNDSNGGGNKNQIIKSLSASQLTDFACFTFKCFSDMEGTDIFCPTL